MVSSNRPNYTNRQSMSESILDVDSANRREESFAYRVTMTKGVGTPLWMAPELFVGGTKYGPEVDVYSFGMILWELTTRRVPWADDITETRYLQFFAALESAHKQGRRPMIGSDVVRAHPRFTLLLQECWVNDPQSRPTFAAIVPVLAGIIVTEEQGGSGDARAHATSTQPSSTQLKMAQTL